jgi:hypothetical protein
MWQESAHEVQQLQSVEQEDERAQKFEAVITAPPRAGKSFKPKRIPSLYALCNVIVSMNIEKLSKQPFWCMLQEEQFAAICKLRYNKCRFQNEEQARRSTGKKPTPCISEKVLERIELTAPQLISKETDSILWREIVNYSFAKGGGERSSVFNEPYYSLVDRIEKSVMVLEKELTANSRSSNSSTSSTTTAITTTTTTANRSSSIPHHQQQESEETFVHDCEALAKALDEIVSSPLCPQLFCDTNCGKVVKRLSKETRRVQTILVEEQRVTLAEERLKIPCLEKLRKGSDGNEESLALCERGKTWKFLNTLLRDRFADKQARHSLKMREKRVGQNGIGTTRQTDNQILSRHNPIDKVAK